MISLYVFMFKLFQELRECRALNEFADAQLRADGHLIVASFFCQKGLYPKERLDRLSLSHERFCRFRKIMDSETMRVTDWLLAGWLLWRDRWNPIDVDEDIADISDLLDQYFGPEDS